LQPTDKIVITAVAVLFISAARYPVTLPIPYLQSHLLCPITDFTALANKPKQTSVQYGPLQEQASSSFPHAFTGNKSYKYTEL
jgi:hypothetical protein